MTDTARHEGEPHTIIALHGRFGWGQGWGADFPELLARAAGEDSTILWIDYRGYGERLGETGEYTLGEIADDVLARLDAAGVERFTLVGHSMGGAAALRIAARAPGRVRAIVGVSPVGATPTPFDDASRQLFEGAPAEDANRAAIIDATTSHRHSQTWVQHLVAESREHSTEESFGRHLHAWTSADFADEVPSDLPALVVVGAHDPALGEGPSARRGAGCCRTPRSWCCRSRGTTRCSSSPWRWPTRSSPSCAPTDAT